MAYFSANAQQTQKKVCEKSPNKVCRISANKKGTSCYNTHYAQSFAVCRNEYGYYICCETPGDNNTTYSKNRANAGRTLEETVEFMGLINPGERAPSSQIKACEKSPNKVCRVSANKKGTSCYKTHYAQSFEVCKNEYGYYICCETPGDNNSTYSRYPQSNR